MESSSIVRIDNAIMSQRPERREAPAQSRVTDPAYWRNIHG
jgi:hypothetical protein